LPTSIVEPTIFSCSGAAAPQLSLVLVIGFGVQSLVLATGAGAEMRSSLGTAVFSGMIGVTLFGIFLTPVFLFVLLWFTERKHRSSRVS
jgi:multidrug efflux pump